jgi:hypothetical protein
MTVTMCVTREHSDNNIPCLSHSKDFYNSATLLNYVRPCQIYAQFLPHCIVVAVGGKKILLHTGFDFANRCWQENFRVTLACEVNALD